MGTELTERPATQARRRAPGRRPRSDSARGQAGARQDRRRGDHAALTRNECATVLNVSRQVRNKISDIHRKKEEEVWKRVASSSDASVDRKHFNSFGTNGRDSGPALGRLLGAEDACLSRLRSDAESSGTARQRGKGKDRKEDKQTCRPPATEASCGGSPARLAEPREPRSPLFSNSRSLARRSRSGHREPARTGASSTRPSSRRDPEGAEAGRGVFR